LTEISSHIETEKRNLLDKLQYIKGVGPKRAEAFINEGIRNTFDLLTYFPRAYIDRTGASSIRHALLTLKKLENIESENSIADFVLTPEVTIIGRIISISEHNFAGRKKLLKIILNDGSGTSANILFWNRINIFKSIYKEGMVLSVSGKPQQDKYNSITYSHPEIDILDEEDEQVYKAGGILPKYRISEKMAAAHINLKVMRMIIKNLIASDLKFINETLPNHIIEISKLQDIKSAISNLHFPTDNDALNYARYRIKFEEIFYFLMKVELSRKSVKVRENGVLIDPKSSLARQLYDTLPFELTADQKKFLWDAAADMKSGCPMNRLLQGDVGSGKTIVSLLLILMVVDSGYQCAFMAPTEILAEQHFKSISKYLEPYNIKIVQLVGGQKNRIRNQILQDIAEGSARIVVGTHALFQSNIEYNNLALVVIDEQHRFGVEQRGNLIKLSKKSHEGKPVTPHVLVMSATPIPRTLTMTAYGDLDVSIIKTMPKNRKPIITKVAFDSNREQINSFLRNEVNSGRQAYIVYPLVEKSEKLELKAATEHYEYLKTEVFPDLKCGLLHGQMFWYEKEEAMNSFLNKEYDILIATTVIEVGIDIPNASIMIIEDAERFGLSQLHQLRGRVGRGTDQSYCFLMTKDKFKYNMKHGNSETEERTAAIIRLKTMEETSDGFKIAEVDLRLRGPGDILGTRQSGMPEFKYIDLINDAEVISHAKNTVIDTIEKDANLKLPQNSIIRSQLINRFGSENSFLSIA